MYNSKSLLLICLASLCLLFPFVVLAEEGNVRPNTQPIRITSDSMEAETKANKVTFRGNVVTKQNDMTITSDALVASYINGGKELSDVLATGNVRITQQDKLAVAERALFVNVERKIILTGNPKVWQGKDVVTGEKIVYFVDEDRMTIEGGDGRVRVILHPKKEEAFANNTGKGVK